MAGKTYHRFVSAVADGGDATIVRPQSNWNDTHDSYEDVNAQTGTSYTLAASDNCSLVTFSNASAIAVSLAQANSGSITPGTLGFFKGWSCFVKNLGAGAVTITPTTSTIGGASTFVLQQNEEAIIISDGTNYQIIRGWSLSKYANSFVRWDASQSLTDAQAAQARANIYTPPFDALAFNGMQVNGSMDVSQENGTSGVTLTAGGSLLTKYILDMVYAAYRGSFVVTGQQVTDAPPGYSNSLKFTVGTAESSLGANDELSIRFPIEGYRAARLAFGTASAAGVSFGFWVKAHRTGAYSGTVRNSAGNRSNPFSFTINSADTWEYKTVTLTGDTTGTWASDNTVGLLLCICIAGGSSRVVSAGWQGNDGSGVTGTTNGVAATSDVFQITGLIVLPGIELPSSSRAPLIMRPAPTELLVLQRYYAMSYPQGTLPGASTSSGASCSVNGPATNSYAGIGPITLPCEMRASPSVSCWSTSGVANKIRQNNAAADVAATINTRGPRSIDFNVNSAATAVNDTLLVQWIADARL